MIFWLIPRKTIFNQIIIAIQLNVKLIKQFMPFLIYLYRIIYSTLGPYWHLPKARVLWRNDNNKSFFKNSEQEMKWFVGFIQKQNFDNNISIMNSLSLH